MTHKCQSALAAFATVVALLSAACAGERPAPPADSTVSDDLQRRSGYVIDSIRPMAEELRIFRELVGEEPDSLQSAASTREALVRRFMASLASRDSATLAAMHLGRAEFAYFYFPGSRFATPPYELPPGLVWSQITSESNKGIRTALRLLGGTDIDYRGHECRQAPAPIGDGQLWGNCRVTWRVSTTGDTASGILFGSILERRGRFKFVSYANDL